MIYRIFSTLATFKELVFRPGFNLVTAEKSPDATNRQTRNGAGKSSILDIVHFILGGSCDKPKDGRGGCIFRLPDLEKHTFGMQFDLAEDRVVAERSGASHGRLSVDSDFSEWPLHPSLDSETGDYQIKVKDWNLVLGARWFDIPSELSKPCPTFRSIFPYFARRQADGGFSSPESFFAQQKVGDQQIALSYLLGIDWHIAGEFQKVRDKKRSFETLKREASAGVLQRYVGESGELRSKLTVAQRRLERVQADIAAFQVLPEYHDLEREASRLARQISDMANANTLERQRIDQFHSALTEEAAPDSSILVQVYQQAGIALPDLVVRRIDEVEHFHKAVLRNRRSHLQQELSDAERRLQERQGAMAEIDSRRLEILGVLSAHGALEQLTRLHEEASRVQAETEVLRRQYNDARQLESLGSEIKLEFAQLYQRLIREIEEDQARIDAAVLLFEEFSGSLSEHQGHLSISASEQGPRFEVEVSSGRSVGIKNMQIFCFDLTLATLWTRIGKGPRVLFHDSHLFDGVDSRQVAKALEVAARTAASEGFQYVVTLNSDAVPVNEFSGDFDISRYLVRVELDDATETGGLFGFRF